MIEVPWSPELFPQESVNATDIMGFDLPDGRIVSFGPLDAPAEGFCISLIRKIPGSDRQAKLVFALTKDATLALFTLMLPFFTKYWCSGCGQEIDPDICYCGEPINGGNHDNHSPVPIGCNCHRES